MISEQSWMVHQGGMPEQLGKSQIDRIAGGNIMYCPGGWRNGPVAAAHIAIGRPLDPGRVN